MGTRYKKDGIDSGKMPQVPNPRLCHIIETLEYVSPKSSSCSEKRSTVAV